MPVGAQDVEFGGGVEPFTGFPALADFAGSAGELAAYRPALADVIVGINGKNMAALLVILLAAAGSETAR